MKANKSLTAIAFTAVVVFGGTMMSGNAAAAPQVPPNASVAQTQATDFSANRRQHGSHRRQAFQVRHGAYRAGYVSNYRRSEYLQPAYSGYSYGAWQPSYVGGGYYGGLRGGHGFGRGFGHVSVGHRVGVGGHFGHGGLGHGWGGHGGFGHGGFGHH